MSRIGMFFLTKIALSFSLAALLGKRSFYNGFGGYMNTYIPKKADLQRRWYVVDAEDVVLGRLATHVANLLSGKGKPVWTPFLDHGDHVIVINAKKIKLAVLCEESKVQEAKEAGADLSGADSLVQDITNGKINFDKLVVTPGMMPKMGKLGKILGPKGLMPNPKLGTVTNNIKSIVKAIKSGQIEIKNDKDGNIGASIGRKSFSDIKIKENYASILETILKEKPSGIKGDFILSAFLTSTMGISYKLKLSK